MCEFFPSIKGEVPENDVFGKKLRKKTRLKERDCERKCREKQRFFVKNKWGKMLQKTDNFSWKKIRQKAAKNDVFEDKFFFLNLSRFFKKKNNTFTVVRAYLFLDFSAPTIYIVRFFFGIHLHLPREVYKFHLFQHYIYAISNLILKSIF